MSDDATGIRAHPTAAESCYTWMLESHQRVSGCDEVAGDGGRMNTQILGERRKTLEETFFAKENEKHRLALQQKKAVEAAKESLAEVSGVSDDAVLEHLLALDIGSDTMAALSLIPLVEVAWADGSVDDSERDAIVAAADAAGLTRESTSGQLLEGWLTRMPDPAMIMAWKAYVKALSATLPEEDKQVLRQDLLGRARAVAEATGGFLGLGNKISKSEQAVLDELAQAFS